MRDCGKLIQWRAETSKQTTKGSKFALIGLYLSGNFILFIMAGIRSSRERFIICMLFKNFLFFLPATCFLAFGYQKSIRKSQKIIVNGKGCLGEDMAEQGPIGGQGSYMAPAIMGNKVSGPRPVFLGAKPNLWRGDLLGCDRACVRYPRFPRKASAICKKRRTAYSDDSEWVQHRLRSG